MARLPQCLLSILALVLMAPPALPAEQATGSAKAEAELRESIRLYDDALRRGDARIAHLREQPTSLDSVAHAPQDEVIHLYMDGQMTPILPAP
jgi:hypothetical protein